MKKTLVFVAALAFVGCGTTSGTDAGSTVDSGMTVDAGPAHDFSTQAKIMAFLDQKTMIMEAANIPAYPNGFNENLDLGAYTQCYHKVTIATLSGAFTVTTEMGQFNKADAGIVGMCDHSIKSAALTPVVTQGIIIQNIANNGECFDLDVSYGSYSQVGRGKISADGKTFTMELYLPTAKVSANRCADGAVGSKAKQTVGATTPPTVVDYTNNSQQVYVLQ